MSKHHDADLILKLYDLRREKTMRDARSWFFTFNPQSPKDFLDVLTSDKSGYYRMVVSYWDMACSFVNNGAIDEQMFNDANGEHIFVYAKMEPYVDALRAESGNPEYLAHLEKVVKSIPNYETKIVAVRERIRKIVELYQQRAAAQAAAAGN
ncbi:MAG TPA: hypothetical protein VKB02_05905 [Pyrinomonadaceae bacterium]|nr:hypothetical protein [Pyrinomonadaceae bacterium]